MFPHPKNVKTSEVKCEDDVDSFFYTNGIVHAEFLPLCQTANQEFNLSVLKRLHDAVRWKVSKMWQSGEWVFQHTMCLTRQPWVCHLSWQKMAWPRFPVPPICQTSLRETCFCFLALRDHKGKILWMWKKWRKHYGITKRHYFGRVPGQLREVEKHLTKCLPSNWEYFEEDKLTCKNK